jgi:hypothetical protein
MMKMRCARGCKSRSRPRASRGGKKQIRERRRLSRVPDDQGHARASTHHHQTPPNKEAHETKAHTQTTCCCQKSAGGGIFILRLRLFFFQKNNTYENPKLVRHKELYYFGGRKERHLRPFLSLSPHKKTKRDFTIRRL